MRILLLALMLPTLAQAKDCGWNSERTNYNCDGFFSGAAVGGSAPLMGDSLEGNPAALPTQPTPFGLEGVFSDRSAPRGKPKFSVSTVKGFDGFGFGIGSWSEGTFGAPDFDNHFLGSAARAEFQAYQRNPSSVIGFRLGTTVVLPQGPFPKGIRVSVGGSLGLGRVYGKLAPQWGVLVKFFFLGLGYSESHERLSDALPKNKIITMSAGLPLGPLYLGYSQITVKSSVNRSKANVLSARWTSPLWTLYGNAKLQKDHRGEPDSWIRAGLQRRFGKNGRFGAGYEYGLYRYSHSAIFQFYL
jgi:hypothetical protein